MCLSRTAVAGEWSKSGTRYANLVIVSAVGRASGATGADQVERAGCVDCAADVIGRITCAVLVEVACDDRVLERRRAGAGGNTTARTGRIVVVVSAIVGERAVNARHRAAQYDETAAIDVGVVAADGGVDERQTRSSRGGDDRAAI